MFSSTNSHQQPVARQVSRLYAKSLEHAAQLRALEQRFVALQERYAALAPAVKSAQNPQLLEHAIRCYWELGGNLNASLLRGLGSLRQTLDRAYFTTLEYNLVEATNLLTTVQVQLREAQKLCDIAEASLVVLESYGRAIRLREEHNAALAAIETISLRYEELQKQCEAIDPVVRQAATVSIPAVLTYISAFASHHGAAPQFLAEKQALGRLLGAIKEAIDAHHFGLAEVLLRDACTNYTKLRQFVVDLGKAVQEYQKIELQMLDIEANIRVYDWMSGVHSPTDPVAPSIKSDGSLQSDPQGPEEQETKVLKDSGYAAWWTQKELQL